jgi:hypothetical protein
VFAVRVSHFPRYIRVRGNARALRERGRELISQIPNRSSYYSQLARGCVGVWVCGVWAHPRERVVHGQDGVGLAVHHIRRAPRERKRRVARRVVQQHRLAAAQQRRPRRDQVERLRATARELMGS